MTVDVVRKQPNKHEAIQGIVVRGGAVQAQRSASGIPTAAASAWTQPCVFIPYDGEHVLAMTFMRQYRSLGMAVERRHGLPAACSHDEHLTGECTT